MAKHTDLPWYVQTTIPDEDGRYVIASAPLDEDNFVAYVEGRTPEEARANAELIVRAVNSYHKTLETLRNVRQALSNIAATGLFHLIQVDQILNEIEELEKRSTAQDENQPALAISDEDVFAVLQEHGKATSIDDEIVAKCREAIMKSADEIAATVDLYDDPADQEKATLAEIETILVESGILRFPKKFDYPSRGCS